MITIDDLRECAMSLPQVEEKPHFGRPAFRVCGNLFASVDPDDSSAIVHVGEAHATAAADDDPDTCTLVWREHAGRPLFVGLRIDLDRTSPARCRQLVELAWRNRAGNRLVAAFDEGT